MFASSLSKERQGTTRIEIPVAGVRKEFKLLLAGDFFIADGKLYFKLNLEDAKEITTGKQPSLGVIKFPAEGKVNAVDVVISVR